MDCCQMTGSSDISCLPVLDMVDIYNYLSNFDMYMMYMYMMGNARMWMDIYHLYKLNCSRSQNFCIVKANVKPRTRYINPVTKIN